MPYMIAKKSDSDGDSKWCTYKKGSDGKPEGESFGCHATEEEAKDQLAALYASEERGRSAGAAFLEGLKATIGKWFGSGDALSALSEDPITSPDPAVAATRALSISDIYSQITEALYALDPNSWPWIDGLFIDNERIYCIVSSRGKLYRYAVTVDGTDVTLGDVEEVEIEHVPVSAGDADTIADGKDGKSFGAIQDEEYARHKASYRSSTVIMRQKDGRTRWISRSCSSVLNRVGEFDTRALFDSFIEHARLTGEYPYRTFYHQGEQLRTGQADFLAREGDIYITSGLYDLNNPLADLEIAARAADPDYYGESIGYAPTEAPEAIQLTPEITAYAYTKGIHREISTVVEHEAASWFTGTAQMEVDRMRNKTAESRLREMGVKAGWSEQQVDELIASFDDTQRSITAEGLVTRDTNQPSVAVARNGQEAAGVVREPKAKSKGKGSDAKDTKDTKASEVTPKAPATTKTVKVPVTPATPVTPAQAPDADDADDADEDVDAKTHAPDAGEGEETEDTEGEVDSGVAPGEEPHVTDPDATENVTDTSAVPGQDTPAGEADESDTARSTNSDEPLSLVLDDEALAALSDQLVATPDFLTGVIASESFAPALRAALQARVDEVVQARLKELLDARLGKIELRLGPIEEDYEQRVQAYQDDSPGRKLATGTYRKTRQAAPQQPVYSPPPTLADVAAQTRQELRLPGYVPVEAD